MADLIAFLKILLFGGSTLLNTDPISVGKEELVLEFEEPLGVVTTGAHLEIDITNHIKSGDLHEKFEEIYNLYPTGCVVAVLETHDDYKVSFSESVGAIGDQDTVLKLFSETELSKEIEFDSMTITSCKEIKNTTLIWKNWSK